MTASPIPLSSKPALTSAEMENLVRRSYQYVALYDSLVDWASNEESLFYGGGWNETCFPKGLVKASARGVPQPNNDTLYVVSMLDLRAEPVIVHYPAFTSRFVSLVTTALDHYVNVPLATSKGDFEQPTSVLYYSAHTHGYSAEPVEGVDKIVEMSGAFAVSFLRVMPEAADPVKFEANMAAIQRLKVDTLSRFQGKPAKRVVEAEFPTYDGVFGTAFAGVSSIFETAFLPVMQFVFNHTTFDASDEMDQAALAALAAVGVEPGKQYDAAKAPALDGIQLAAVAKEMAKRSLATWVNPETGAPFYPKAFRPKGHTDIDTMVILSAIGPVGLPANQAMYPWIGTSDGKPTNARNDYVIRMTEAELPPAIAFWSVTLYDAEHGFFIPNEANKYSVGHSGGMKLNASGGIEIHIAAEQPKGVPAENWLPIPREDLDLHFIMRVFQPDLEKMKTWTAPKAELVK
ncbi:MAG: hypothetical protein CL908_03065 [Deltaproteobacteria bacterium]|nr:hypothetical protein [Deltaproteobacteria bacterium]